MIYERSEHFIGEGFPSLQIEYTNSEDIVYQWIAAHVLSSSEKNKYLGYDTENKPVFRRGEKAVLSVVQLATRTHAIVIQWNKYIRVSSGSPGEHCLAKLLSTPLTHLCGMGVKADVKSWHKVLTSEILASEVSHPSTHDLEVLCRGRGGLQASTKSLLPTVVEWKKKKIQMSNWSLSPLSREQFVYAAMDAWAGLAAYEAFVAAQPSPPAKSLLEPIRHNVGGAAATMEEKEPTAPTPQAPPSRSSLESNWKGHLIQKGGSVTANPVEGHPLHRPQFVGTAVLRGITTVGPIMNSKKEAEREASRCALEALGGDDCGAQVSSKQTKTRTLPRDKICRFFGTPEGCKHGDACKFLHSAAAPIHETTSADAMIVE